MAEKKEKKVVKKVAKPSLKTSKVGKVDAPQEGIPVTGDTYKPAAKKIKKEVKKANGHCYVLDTNVLVYDPEALYAFEGSSIVIPAVVLEEIDNFKGETTARGRNSREIIRHLDRLRTRGSLAAGVTLDNGCLVRVMFRPSDVKLPDAFNAAMEDNEILMTALSIKQSGSGVIFVSKDLNARVKADVLGIESEDYLHDDVSKDHFYHGWLTLPVPAVQLKQDIPKDLMNLPKDYELMPHQYVLVESQHNPYQNRVFKYLGKDRFRQVNQPRFQWDLRARNPQQLMALDLLLDDEIKLVTLFGPAGTGKTFLAMLAGLHKVLVEDAYRKMLISRPVVPLGKDIGYLPGTVEEKMHSWMLPIFDNMEFILHSSLMAQHARGEGRHESHRRHKKDRHKKDHREKGKLRPLDQLIRDEKISLEPITYMRGRSIPYQFIVIDEVQNLSPHEVKTLISRVGEGSKIILTGDPYQIDSPYLDFSSNGLVIVSERFKGQKIFGSVHMPHSERSELSQLTSELL